MRFLFCQHSFHNVSLFRLNSDSFCIITPTGTTNQSAKYVIYTHTFNLYTIFYSFLRNSVSALFFLECKVKEKLSFLNMLNVAL